MPTTGARCRKCGGDAKRYGQPYELRCMVFEEAMQAQEEVLRLCGRCKAAFPTERERDTYLECVLLA